MDNVEDLAEAFDVRPHSSVKQVEQQDNQRNNDKVFQWALRSERAAARLGLVTAALTFGRRVRQIVATSAGKRIAGSATCR